jgi:hypothetical protein
MSRGMIQMPAALLLWGSLMAATPSLADDRTAAAIRKGKATSCVLVSVLVTLHCSRSHPRGILTIHSVPTTTHPEQAGANRRLYAPHRCCGTFGAFSLGECRA